MEVTPATAPATCSGPAKERLRRCWRSLATAAGIDETLAESAETCVIYGMPKAAVEAGVVDRAVPLTRVADEILAAV